jgi:hypothetical protein
LWPGVSINVLIAVQTPRKVFRRIFAVVKMTGCFLRIWCWEENARLQNEEVTGVWGKLRNEKLFDLYSFVTVIRMIKCRRII